MEVFSPQVGCVAALTALTIALSSPMSGNHLQDFITLALRGLLSYLKDCPLKDQLVIAILYMVSCDYTVDPH